MNQLKTVIDGSVSPLDSTITYKIAIKEYDNDELFDQCFLAFTNYISK